MKRAFVMFIAFFLFLVLLFLGYYFSPLLLDKVVDEEIPFSQNGGYSIISLGNFQNADSFHYVRGESKIISDGDLTYLRFENFESKKGLLLKVFLSKDLGKSDYLDLGDLKGNIGNQNYELTGINYEEYNYVLIWSEGFSTLFGYSPIN